MVVLEDSDGTVLQTISTDLLRAEVERLRRLVAELQEPPEPEPGKQPGPRRLLTTAVDDVDDAYSASSRSASPAHSHGCAQNLRSRSGVTRLQLPPLRDVQTHADAR